MPNINPLSGGVTTGFTLRQVTTITGSQTYTVPAGVSALYVRCWGGGGQGGGTPGTAGSGNGQCVAAGGGGGGGYASSFLTSLAASYSVTIGAGGSTGTAGQAGQAGGDTIFGSSLLVAKGGGGGPIGVVDIGTFPDTSGAPGQRAGRRGKRLTATSVTSPCSAATGRAGPCFESRTRRPESAARRREWACRR